MKTMKYLILLVSLISINYYPQQFQFEWELPVNGFIYYLGDIDGDGVGEFLDLSPGTIHSGIDGSINTELEVNHQIANIPMLARLNTKHFDFDYNGNGVKDFYGQDGNIMRIIDPSTNEIIFEYQGNTVSEVRWIGDFDNDGIIEICIDDYDNSLQSAKAVVYSTGISLTSLDNGEFYKPRNFNLYQNYPNPFNPSTIIEYELNKFAKVELKIFDSLGALVKVLVNQEQDRALYKVNWDGKDERGFLVASGTYYYELKAGNSLITKKMILIK